MGLISVREESIEDAQFSRGQVNSQSWGADRSFISHSILDLQSSLSELWSFFPAAAGADKYV